MSVGKRLILLYASASFTLDKLSCVLGGRNVKRSGELMGVDMLGAVVQLSYTSTDVLMMKQQRRTI